jgi:hypothetical protein
VDWSDTVRHTHVGLHEGIDVPVLGEFSEESIAVFGYAGLLGGKR